ncbi:MAG TPA: DNA-binding response regulator [Myxococcales bacterium]|nr:DNA-binding response regulator [Myxococcales bacterium]
MDEKKSRILVVEDDLSILTGLSINLRHEGYEILQAQDGDRALQLAFDEQPDLMVLDIMLPGMNGFEVLKELRRRGSRLPVVVLSARALEHDKIMGLELGADDYVSKPFGLKELLARVRAVMRRHQTGPSSSFCFAAVEVDFGEHCVRRDGAAVAMTAQEFRLLKYFLEHPGRVLTRQSLLEGAWGFDYQGTTRTVDNFVRSLRAKLEQDPEEPRHFLTVRGVGYRFVA